MAPSSLPLSLLAATLIPVLTLATEAPPANPPTPVPAAAAATLARPELNARQRELLEKFDANHDGRIDDDEKLAARTYMRTQGKGGPKERYKKALKLFDKNGDGKLDDAERAEADKAREEFQANREVVMAKFDKNKDGVLDDEERAAAMKAREERQRRRLEHKDAN